MITKKLSYLLFFLLISIIITSCQINTSEDELNGRITLWHSWSPKETIVLEKALAEFEEVHRKVQIVTVAMPKDQILENFNEAGKDGFGPDVILSSNHRIGELVSSGLIRPFSSSEIETGFFNSRNKALTQYQGEQYGVPLILAPHALYYNKSVVTKPPESLNDLLQEAAAGNRVAFVPRFADAYWGIPAFGENLFDTQGNFTLAESGFTDWLSWLETARGAPGIILSADDDSLLELFTSGEVAYYIAGPERQDVMKNLVDKNEYFEIGVTPLPNGPDGSASPLLSAETILLYAYSSPEQAKIADALAAFLVNEQQSIKFMRELDLVPANPTITIDKLIYPLVHSLAQQTKTAVVFPNEVPVDPLEAAGNKAYISVISGAATPAEAVCTFGREVTSFLGYIQDKVSLPEGCTLSENIQIQNPSDE